MTSKTTPKQRAEWRQSIKDFVDGRLDKQLLFAAATVNDLLDDLEAAEKALAEQEEREESLQTRISVLTKKHGILMNAAQQTYKVVQGLMGAP